MATRKPQSKITSEDLALPLEEPSLLFAQRELIRTNGIDFEEWWEEFRKGFIGGKRAKDTNYKTALWTKPRYVDITPATSTSGAMTIEYWPDKDKTGNSYLLSGTVSDIIRGIMDIMRTSNTRTNFETWFKQWEVGFPIFKENRNGNFLLTGKEQWNRIKSPETRPKYKEWTNLQQRADFEIRVIEYWRDRSNEVESILLSGTDLQLIQHIIQIEYERRGGQQESVSSDIIRYSGIPEIKLFFRGRDASLPAKDQVVVGQKSFRLMGYTDNPEMAEKRADLELITQADINRIGAKIRSVFKTTPPYIWEKGKKQVVYHDWSRGYNLNVYSSTHVEGERLIAAILSVRDLEIDEAFIKYSEAKNPTKAYPPSREIQVLGKKYKTPERLLNVDVEFQYAQIYLPTVKQKKIM